MGVPLLCLGLAAGALATDPGAPAPPDNRETIVVTGERVKRSLKETPTSVTVFDKRDMDRMAAPDRIQQLLQMVPNVLVPTSRDPPVIRGQAGIGVLDGLPAFLGGARPRTVLQIDGRTVTFGEFTQTDVGLWDVDHVEVFVSPQTTTQGVNSIGGAIFIHTAAGSTAGSFGVVVAGGVVTGGLAVVGVEDAGAAGAFAMFASIRRMISVVMSATSSR